MENDFSIWFLLYSLYSKGNLPETASRESRIEEARNYILNYVWEEMRRYDETHPPFLRGTDPSKLPFVKSRKIKNITFSETKNFDAYLLPYNDGFNIILNKKISNIRRVRTIIAHEIAHTFLFNLNTEPPSPYYSSDGLDWNNEEGPVYEISRSILVPEKWIKRYDKRPSLKNFNMLRQKFNVSKDVMARRLIHDLKLWDVYMFFTNYNEKLGYFELPKSHLRFRSRIELNKSTIKNFKLDVNWKTIELILQDCYRNARDIIEKSITIKDERYNIEAIYRDNLSPVICIVSKDFSPVQLTFDSYN